MNAVIEETTVERACLALRWVVLVTGFTAADDYQPTSSRGVTMALTDEVTKMCVAFHPVSQIHRLPPDSPVFLFWRARSSGDWIVTRISVAPNPQGLRTALEYCTLILDEKSFRALRYNPFRTRSLNLHDRVRRHHMARRTAPLDYELTKSSAAPIGHVTGANHQEFPEVSEDRISNEVNVGAIQEFCSHWTADPVPPPTFATWWPSRSPIPESYFDIVLRAPEPRAMPLQEARAAITQLCSDLKASLPTPASSDLAAVELVRSLLSDATEAEGAVSHAAAFVHNETPESLAAQLTESALKINRLRMDLGSLLTRLEGSLGEEDVFQLQTIAGRTHEIEQGKQAIRHPNPFRKVTLVAEPAASGGTAVRTAETDSAPTSAPATEAKRPWWRRYLPVAGAVGGLLALCMALHH